LLRGLFLLSVFAELLVPLVPVKLLALATAVLDEPTASTNKECSVLDCLVTTRAPSCGVILGILLFVRQTVARNPFGEEMNQLFARVYLFPLLKDLVLIFSLMNGFQYNDHFGSPTSRFCLGSQVDEKIGANGSHGLPCLNSRPSILGHLLGN